MITNILTAYCRAVVRLELANIPFARTTAIHFEISNRCNLASKHSNCPVGPQFKLEKAAAGGKLGYSDYLTNGTYLSLEVVTRSIEELGQYGFLGISIFTVTMTLSSK